MTFEPDFHHLVDAVCNRRPERFPLYEHYIAPDIMARILEVDMSLDPASQESLRFFYRHTCRFWRAMTYDTVSFEAGICGTLPGHGAIFGGKTGPIQSREDFERYPFDELPERYWSIWTPHLESLAESLPEGMKAVGGCGNGPFELSEDLVGYERLCLMMYEDPDLFRDLYNRIGDLLVQLWTRMLRDYGDLFCVCRIGDDLGYKTSTLVSPDTIRAHVLPQYTRVIHLVHDTGKPFLLHSCGCIFSVMDDLIAAGIDAKHSNEDQIAPFSDWIERYGDRIGLLGGIDVDRLCRDNPKAVYEDVFRLGSEFRNSARGYALGSGNSIPAYVPPEGYFAMIEAGQEIRRREAG